MSKNIDQKTVDEKIHRFLARKSPLRTLSETIADHFALVRSKRKRVGISYEQI